MTDSVWRPNSEWIERAHVSRLMRSLGFEVDPNGGPAHERSVREFVKRSADDTEWFWNAALKDMGLLWDTPYHTLLDLSKGPAYADWFVGGKLNIARNCLDRHARSELADQPALISETEDGQVKRWTFAELERDVSRLADALQKLGVKPGERIASYMPMIGEVAIAMFAAHKIGAVFVPIFSGYAPPAVRDRLEDGEVAVVFTSDAALRRGKAFALKAELDRALSGLTCVRHVIVHQRGQEIACPMQTGRDLFWKDAVASASDVSSTLSVPSMHPALMLYTSGTTGKPKGTVHTHAGSLAQMGKELLYNFDVRPGDVFFWFTDIGWMMGPWELIGALMHGATVVMLEGAPDYPAPDRVWRTIEAQNVTTLGISPTAVRLLIRSGDEHVDKHPMPSLRMLGSTGEPWDPESYLWYFEKVGKGRCPVINISGGTDIAGCFLAPLPVLPLRAATLQSPGLGMAVDVFDENGRSLIGEVGYLVCKKPSPSMTRSLWKNDAKYLEAYWSKFPNIWNHGDWAMVDAEGFWYLFGRADDTLKIAGRRVGPGEIEAALIEHDAVSEAAAIGVPDPLKGTEVVCFVMLHAGYSASEELRAELVQQVVDALGKVDKPKAVFFVDDLPKTRSAKIVRRLVQQRYLGKEDLGDLSSIANPDALEAIGRAR